MVLLRGPHPATPLCSKLSAQHVLAPTGCPVLSQSQGKQRCLGK